MQRRARSHPVGATSQGHRLCRELRFGSDRRKRSSGHQTASGLFLPYSGSAVLKGCKSLVLNSALSAIAVAEFYLTVGTLSIWVLALDPIAPFAGLWPKARPRCHSRRGVHGVTGVQATATATVPGALVGFPSARW